MFRTVHGTTAKKGTSSSYLSPEKLHFTHFTTISNFIFINLFYFFLSSRIKPHFLTPYRLCALKRHCHKSYPTGRFQSNFKQLLTAIMFLQIHVNSHVNRGQNIRTASIPCSFEILGNPLELPFTNNFGFPP